MIIPKNSGAHFWFQIPVTLNTCCRKPIRQKWVFHLINFEWTPIIVIKVCLFQALLDSLNFVFPEEECFNSRSGIDYMGHTNTSKSGKSCLDWTVISSELDVGVVDKNAKNFCRYPDISPTIIGQAFNSPVCVVDDGKGGFEMDECGVLHCS